MSTIELASPPVKNGDFTRWLDTIVFSAWAVDELGHQPRSAEDIQFCHKRIEELKRLKKAG